MIHFYTFTLIYIPRNYKLIITRFSDLFLDYLPLIHIPTHLNVTDITSMTIIFAMFLINTYTEFTSALMMKTVCSSGTSPTQATSTRCKQPKAGSTFRINKCFVTYVHTRIHIANSNGALFIAIKK